MGVARGGPAAHEAQCAALGARSICVAKRHGTAGAALPRVRIGENREERARRDTHYDEGVRRPSDGVVSYFGVQPVLSVQYSLQLVRTKFVVNEQQSCTCTVLQCCPRACLLQASCRARPKPRTGGRRTILQRFTFRPWPWISTKKSPQHAHIVRSSPL